MRISCSTTTTCNCSPCRTSFCPRNPPLPLSRRRCATPPCCLLFKSAVDVLALLDVHRNEKPRRGDTQLCFRVLDRHLFPPRVALRSLEARICKLSAKLTSNDEHAPGRVRGVVGPHGNCLGGLGGRKKIKLLPHFFKKAGASIPEFRAKISKFCSWTAPRPVFFFFNPLLPDLSRRARDESAHINHCDDDAKQSRERRERDGR